MQKEPDNKRSILDQKIIFIIIFLIAIFSFYYFFMTNKSEVSFLNQDNQNRFELTYSKASVLATKLAQSEAKKKKFFDVDGTLIPFNENMFEDMFTYWMEVKIFQNRWQFSNIAFSSGFSAEVEFNLDGSNPKVKISFSSD
jgi:hypothetical protein